MVLRSRLEPESSRGDALLLRAIGLGVLILGCRAAWLYHAAGLTLSHYDAKAHLVVARRIVDSLTPGWRQLGAVWLPLPHLLNLVPVQLDVFYRTGASAVAISVLAFALAAFGISRIVLRLTGSRPAALAGAAALALNPDLLYLQSTPMTEALLVGLLVMAVSLTLDWMEDAEGPKVPSSPLGGFPPSLHGSFGEAGGEASRRSALRQAPFDFAQGPRATSRGQGAVSLSNGEGPKVGAGKGRSSVPAGLTIAAACLTRYEAWPITAALLALCAIALWRRGVGGRIVLAKTGRLALYPAIAAATFFVESRLTIGKWFVTGGFFVPDNIDTGNPFRAIASVWWGAHVISGYGVELAAVAGAVACAIVALRNRRHSALIVPLALLTAGALPAYAFFDGHPFRIRYMTPLVPALAVCAGLGVGLLRGRALRALAAACLFAFVLLETHPFDLNAPMLLEAQWDTGNSAARRQVTRYLVAHYDGRLILASMGSLAHYMQELSHAGFDLKDFVHEGNGDIWAAATKDPRERVGWILIEEWAEGGDQLAAVARDNPEFLRGFERVAEGGGVALYQAAPSPRFAVESSRPTVAPR